MMVAARSLLLAAVVLAAALPSVASSRELHELKSRLSRMTAAQIIEEVGEIKPLGPPPPHQSKIEHFVVLFMEVSSAAIESLHRMLPYLPAAPVSVAPSRAEQGVRPHARLHEPAWPGRHPP